MADLLPKEPILEPIEKPIVKPFVPPTHGPRPLSVKGSCWCPACEAAGVKTRMRRECRREGMKWVETGRFCPVCQRWFGGVTDLKSPTAALTVDRPVRPLLLNRERRKERILAAVARLYPGTVDLIKEEP